MPEVDPPRFRQPVSSLATKIISVVFLATFLTAVVVSWISIHASYTYLQRRIDRSYPAILDGAAHRTARWLGDARSELARHAAELAAREEPPLDAWLGRSPHFDALSLRDLHGREVAGVRREDAGPAAAALELVAPSAGDPRLRLHAELARGALASLLVADGLGPGGGLFLLDGTGRILVGEASSASRLPLDALALGTVVEFRDSDGQHRLGALRALPGTDLRLVVSEPYEEAFQPVFAVVTRVFAIDLVILLVFGLLAYQVTSAIVRPVEALSEGARRISGGDFAVEIVETSRRDEIGLLTRTFNDMTRRLLAHRAEIERANQKLLAQNEELSRANEVLEQLSITDGLTKLHNHRYFQDHLTREIKRVSRTSEPLSMLICDIDDFKRLNDRLGHAAGDELLVGIARILDDSIRETDLLARYGGEEFVVLAPNTDLLGAVRLAEKVREEVAQASFLLDDSNRLTKVTISIGVARFQGDRRSFFVEADQALYRAKAAGKNCVRAAEPLGPDGPPEL